MNENVQNANRLGNNFQSKCNRELMKQMKSKKKKNQIGNAVFHLLPFNISNKIKPMNKKKTLRIFFYFFVKF